MARLEPDSQFGIYHIVRRIGGGGMAQIYLAKTKGLAGFEKYLALKVINSDYASEHRFVQMLIDEAKITVKLSHANIAQIFDLGHVSGIYYIAMEYVDGLDVLRLVNGLHRLGKQLPVPAAAFITAQICSGLSYAHDYVDEDGNALQLVHRDISPQNILVSLNGEVKIVDFGIAKAAGLSAKTQAGVVKGKVNYMAPEQVLGHKADHRSDIFSAGIVTWEMLTSQMVYNSDKVSDLVNLVRKAQIVSPSRIRSDVPTKVDHIVMKALAANPTDRYQHADEFRQALIQYVASSDRSFGTSQIASLVREAQSGENAITDTPAQRLSKQDQLSDRHSLIFAATGDGTPRLVLQGHGERRMVEITDGLVIGRAGDVVISDLRVSRHHARINITEGEYLLEDLNSSNGTFINEQRLTGSKPLQHQDEIRIGHTVITFWSRSANSDVPSDAAQLKPRITKLAIEYGKQQLTHIIGKHEIPLSYSVQIGSATLYATVAHIVQQNNEIWLEPTKSRIPIMFNETLLSGPAKVGSNDVVQVGPLRCTFE